MSARQSLGRSSSAPLSLTLYVAGDNAYSRQAKANLDSILADSGVETPVVVVDVLKHPEVTVKNRIFVTPALVVVHTPGSDYLIVGDLTERDKILRILRGTPVTRERRR